MRLVIVPDASTADLDFASLGPADRPLVLDHPLRILPSARLLTPRRRRDIHRPVILGDPRFTDRPISVSRAGSSVATGMWSTLPGTREEAEEVARVLGATPLMGSAASEAALRQAVRGADLVHLATHAFALPRAPEQSAVVLSTPTQGEGQDGLLQAFEIETLELDQPLVVLSACETGVGRVSGNEGTLGLDRAFLVAGASAVVSSLWLVGDAPTAFLMAHFHGRLRDGAPADIALAEAMRATRHARPAWRDPRAWAAFRVVGGGFR
jgi:CHAT domain-containing protein